jgi:hypothetical protein
MAASLDPATPVSFLDADKLFPGVAKPLSGFQLRDARVALRSAAAVDSNGGAGVTSGTRAWIARTGRYGGSIVPTTGGRPVPSTASTAASPEAAPMPVIAEMVT